MIERLLCFRICEEHSSAMMAFTGLRCMNKLLLKSTSRRLPATCTAKRNVSTSEAATPRHCWKCGSVLCEGCTLFCSTPTCEAIQGLDKENTNYFSLFGMKETFNVDDSQLDVSFKNLQRQLHPDKFAMKSTEERERSTYNSSIVNQAYQVRPNLIAIHYYYSISLLFLLQSCLCFCCLLLCPSQDHHNKQSIFPLYHTPHSD